MLKAHLHKRSASAIPAVRREIFLIIAHESRVTIYTKKWRIASQCSITSFVLLMYGLKNEFIYIIILFFLIQILFFHTLLSLFLSIKTFRTFFYFLLNIDVNTFYFDDCD